MICLGVNLFGFFQFEIDRDFFGSVDSLIKLDMSLLSPPLPTLLYDSLVGNSDIPDIF